MRIIDFHAHIYPDKIAEKATNATGDFYGITPACIGTSEALLREGKRAGIDRFVLLPVATRPEQARHINTFIRDEVNAHAEFHGFGTLHPDCAEKPEEAEYILQSGLLGVKLHPDTQGFDTDDKRLFEVYDYLQGRGTLIVHCGDKRFRLLLRYFKLYDVFAAGKGREIHSRLRSRQGFVRYGFPSVEHGNRGKSLSKASSDINGI